MAASRRPSVQQTVLSGAIVQAQERLLGARSDLYCKLRNRQETLLVGVSGQRNAVNYQCKRAVYRSRPPTMYCDNRLLTRVKCEALLRSPSAEIIPIAVVQADLVEFSAHGFYRIVLLWDSAGTVPKVNINDRSITAVLSENGDGQAGL